MRAADVWFIRADRLPSPMPRRGFWPVAPDLAVEVISPTDRWSDLLRTVADYLEAGTRLVWVLHPEKRAAHIFATDRDVTVLDESAMLDGEDVLPGLTLSLAEVLE